MTPYIYMVLSFLVPGVGQYISGRHSDGVFWLIWWAVLVAVNSFVFNISHGVTVLILFYAMLSAYDAYIGSKNFS